MKKPPNIDKQLQKAKEKIKLFSSDLKNRSLFTEAIFGITQAMKSLKRISHKNARVKSLLEIIASVSNRALLQTTPSNLKDLLVHLEDLERALETKQIHSKKALNVDKNLDEDVISVFIEEARDILETIQTLQKIWLEDLENLEVLQEMKRALHTLKGSARMVNEDKISKIAHELEQVLTLASTKNKSLNKNVYDLIYEGHGSIFDLIESLSEHKQLVKVEQIVSHSKEDRSDKSNLILKLPETIKIPSKTLKSLDNQQSLLYAGQIQTVEKLRRLGIGTVDLKMTGLHLNEKLKYFSGLLEKEVFKGRTVEEMKNVDLHTAFMDILELGSDIIEISKKNTFDLRALGDLLEMQKKISIELNAIVSNETIIAFASFTPRLEMLIRKLSQQLDKKVESSVIEDGGEIDRTILEGLMPALEHIIRNAIDHGIESQNVRKEKGKSPLGRIQVDFKRLGMEVIITIQDDGKGIDVEAVRTEAIRRGLIKSSSKQTLSETIDYIFAPGFSTTKKVNEISGRGVGLDVVRSQIERLSGFVDVVTQPDQGTTITLRVPFTLSLNKILLCQVQSQTFGVQLQSIHSVGRIAQEDFLQFAKGKKPYLKHHDQKYKLFYMGALLEKQKTFEFVKTKYYPVILLKGFIGNYAVIVDKVFSYQEVSIKPLGLFLKQVNKCIGASILGNGSIVITLNMVYLINQVKTPKEVMNILPIETKPHMPTIMIVDDSVTVRKVTNRILKQQGYEVVIARNGVEALQQLSESEIDLILLDIEMPKMDGFEVAQFIKQDPKYQHIPIIMISSRTMETHKGRAKSLGVDFFMGKPYQDELLVNAVNKFLNEKTNKRS